MDEGPFFVPIWTCSTSLRRARTVRVVTGTFFSSRGAEPLHALKVIGPGIHRVLTSKGQIVFGEPVPPSQDREKWSRLIGALGEESWQRLRCLRYAVIGAGRTGSLVACSLARLGARYVTFVDPDRLESHNLDAMDGVTERDLGKLKVSTLKEWFTTISGFPEAAHALAASVTSLSALVAAKEADVLISCVDHDGARMATALIAALYAKPLLDIGTEIFIGGDMRRMGGDVRLILPEDRCLVCFGGVANIGQARAIFASEAPLSLYHRPWQEERAGSLRSLNQIAAHLGIRLLEDLVGERVRDSTWLHLEFDSRGIPSIGVPIPPPNLSCVLCRCVGQGDDGISSVKDIMNAGIESQASLHED